MNWNKYVVGPVLAICLLQAGAWMQRHYGEPQGCETLQFDMSTGRSLNYYLSTDDAHGLHWLACPLGQKHPSKADVIAGQCPKEGK